MKYIVIRDCVCEWSVHEVKNYPRPNVYIRKLLKDEIVNEVEIFTNHFGVFIRVKKDTGNEYYDIKPENLKPYIMPEDKLHLDFKIPSTGSNILFVPRSGYLISSLNSHMTLPGIVVSAFKDGNISCHVFGKRDGSVFIERVSHKSQANEYENFWYTETE